MSSFTSTPRDHEHHRSEVSPLKRKRNSRSFSAQEIICEDTMMEAGPVDVTDAASATMLFGSSQDSNITSSQDFNDKFGSNLRIRIAPGHEEYSNQYSNDSFQSSQVTVPNSQLQLEMPVDEYRTPTVAIPGDDTWVTIPPPAANPFLAGTQAGILGKRTTTKWTSPTRYMLDFEEEGVLGDGNFSHVVCSRNRLDGMQYAIKKLNAHATSDTCTRKLTREICALAALQGCQEIVRYYSSWIEDGRIYIQTELCAFGTLDLFVTRPISTFDQQKAIAKSTHIASIGKSLSAASATSNEPINHRKVLKTNAWSSSSSSNSSSNIVATGGGGAGGPGSDDYLPLETPRDKIIPFSSHFSFPFVNSDFNPSAHPTKEILTQSSESGSNNNTTKASGSSPANESTNFKVSQELAWLILSVISKALSFMHARNIAHMDIRPANMFISAAYGPFQECALGLPPVPGYESGTAHNSSSTTTGIIANGGNFNCQRGRSISVASYTSVNSLTEDSPTRSTLPTSTTTTTATTMTTTKIATITPQQRVAKNLLNGEYVLKLGDFGHAIAARNSDPRDLEEGDNRYLAREVMELAYNSVDLSKADIFSLGASVYEICVGRSLDSQEGSWLRIR